MIDGDENLSSAPDNIAPHDEVFLSKREFTNEELLENGPVFTASYLVMREMLSFGGVRVNTVPVKKRFDVLFPGSFNEWVQGMFWASENFARLQPLFDLFSRSVDNEFHVSDERARLAREKDEIAALVRKRRRFVNDIVRRFETGSPVDTEEAVNAVLVAAGFNLEV